MLCCNKRPHSDNRSDTFEGQSQRESETGRPSDERWLPSTSAGIRRFYHLITLQSSTGTLRVVNYFAKQCGDVPRCTVQQSAERNKDADTKLKSVRAGMKKRLSNRERWKKNGEREWRGDGQRVEAEGVSSAISPLRAHTAGDSSALMNKVPDLSVLRWRQRERT